MLSTTPICKPIGDRISSAGTRLTLDGAAIKLSTSSGVWRTASWMGSTLKSSFYSLARTISAHRSSPDGLQESANDITRGLQAILQRIQKKAPAATIIVTGIFPRNDNVSFVPVINSINRGLAKLADGQKIRYLNINDKLADRDGKLFDGMMNADKLHPTVKTYQIWADALKPILAELLGPPAEVDHAPPPTGDPEGGR